MKFFALLCFLVVAVMAVSGHGGISAGIGAGVESTGAGIGAHAGVAGSADIVGAASKVAGVAADVVEADVNFKVNTFNKVTSLVG